MELEEYYEMEKEYEIARQKQPCCFNCQYYHIEYGYGECIKDMMPDEDINLAEYKCDMWK